MSKLHKSNCVKCGSVRSVSKNKCGVCGTEFFVSTRRKRIFPTPDVQKILSRGDKYRAEQVYGGLKGKLSTPERENIRDSVRGKLLKFRHGNGRLELDNGIIYFVGRVQTERGNKEVIRAKTDLSEEEFKLYLATDPDRDKTLRLSPHPPYNLYLSFMREKKPQKEKRHLAEVGVDLNFPKLVAAVAVDGGDPFFVEQPFPARKVRKLLARADKARSEGNLERASMKKSIASRVTKGAYFRFIETVQREVRKSLGLETNKTIKYVWRVENPAVLRRLDTQFVRQGWRPTVMKSCLEEKAGRIYLKIEEVNPAYTSVRCCLCGEINEREGDKLRCKCGNVIDWHRNAAVNILKTSRPSAVGALFTPDASAGEGDFRRLHDKSSSHLARRQVGRTALVSVYKQSD